MVAEDLFRESEELVVDLIMDQSRFMVKDYRRIWANHILLFASRMGEFVMSLFPFSQDNI